MTAFAIGPCARLHDGTGRGITCPLEVGKTQMVNAPIGPVDDDVGRASQLVMQPALDEPANHTPAVRIVMQSQPRRVRIKAFAGHCPVHRFDDVAAFSKCPKRGLDIGCQRPACWSHLLSQSHAFEHLGATNQDRAIPTCARTGFGPQIDLAKRAALLVQAAIETGPAFSVNLARQSIEDITLAARSQLDGHAFLGAGAHPLADIGAVDHEVLAACCDAANQHMDMRIVGIPVIDGHPVKPGVEIAGHIGHQFTRERAQVAHLVRILRRDDEAEVVPVVLAALGKAVPIGLV